MQGVPENFDSVSDRAEFFRPASITGIELYRAHIISHSFDPHTHQAFGLGSIESGVERLRYQGEELLAPAGSLVMMNPEVLHTGRAETPDGWRYRMAYLNPELVVQLSGQHDWYFPQALVFDRAKAHYVSYLLDALWRASEELETASLLFQLIQVFQVFVKEKTDRQTLAQARFKRVLDFLHANLDQRLRLDQLANLAGLSPSHFLRSFQAQYHVTPQQMLMSLRLFKAKQLLADGNTAAQVALETGLTDQAHLTRAFLKRYGVTPARYQKQINSH